MHTDLEHFVDADEIAALLGESRRNVIRMAREGRRRISLVQLDVLECTQRREP